jgi:hypothetical protein
LRHRIPALLEHFVHHGNDGGVVQLDALVHFFLLHGRQQQADGGQTLGLARLHGGFHIIVDAGFQAHEMLQNVRAGRAAKESLTKPAWRARPTVCAVCGRASTPGAWR